jgi:hypothetical protein
MRHLLRISVVGALVAAGGIGAAATPAYAASTIVVGPGQSIQHAVNRAHPGDTILIKPGHYQQSVLVAKNHLRIKGSGASLGGTVIEPSATPSGACAKHDSGICVVGFRETVVGTRIESLLVRNFKDSGVIAFNARGLLVQNVVARDNGEYGIARFASSGGALINNVATGSGEAGLYIGDSPNANVFVAANEVSGNGFGIFYRHSQHAAFLYNNAHDNCIGFFAVSGPPHPPVGDAIVRYNTVRHNNKACKGGEELPFDYSGGGIVLLGAKDMAVGNNSVLSNRGNSPLSGGIVLLSDRTFFGGGPTSSGNAIHNNTAYHNSPADIVDHSGGRNSFRGNFCRTSIPRGLCHH